jgi:ATP-dependent Clp protease adaptor protein ClpS
MTRPEAQSQMLSIHYEGRAICGTYPYEEAEKKVADVLAFAGEHKHPLQCVLDRSQQSLIQDNRSTSRGADDV